MKKLVSALLAVAFVAASQTGATAATGKLKSLDAYSPYTVGANTVLKEIVAFPRVKDSGVFQISPCWRGKQEFLAGGMTVHWDSAENVSLSIKQTYPNPSTQPIKLAQQRFVNAASNQLKFSCPVISNPAGFSTTSTTSAEGTRNFFDLNFSAANKSYLTKGARFAITVKSAAGAILYKRFIRVSALTDYKAKRDQSCKDVTFWGWTYILTGSTFQMSSWAVSAYGAITGNAQAKAAAEGYSYLAILMKPPTDTSTLSSARIGSVKRKDGKKLTLTDQRTFALVDTWLANHQQATEEELLAEITKRFPKTGGYLTDVHTSVGITQTLVDNFDSAVAQNTWALKAMNSVC